MAAKVTCKVCGGPHTAWECPEVEPREPEPAEEVHGRPLKVPWYQPLGVCPSCDRRRLYNARRVSSTRESGRKDW